MFVERFAERLYNGIRGKTGISAKTPSNVLGTIGLAWVRWQLKPSIFCAPCSVLVCALSSSVCDIRACSVSDLLSLKVVLRNPLV